jgi:hypothetical protein
MTALRLAALATVLLCAGTPVAAQKKYVGADGKIRVALAKQPLSHSGPSKGLCMASS